MHANSAIVAEHIHPSNASVFPIGGGLFQQDNAPCHTSKNECFEEQNKGVQGADLVYKLPIFQSDQASLDCAGKRSLIRGSCTSQLCGIDL